MSIDFEVDPMDVEAWAPRSACLGLPDEMFFVPRGGDVRPAKAVCAECPVQQPCLDYAVATRRKNGVWGGKSYSERLTYSMTRAA